MQDSDECALCAQDSETGDHLFLGCVIARELWFMLLNPVGLAALVLETNATLINWWLRERLQLAADARRAFDSLVLLVSWKLWLERNNRTFQGTSAGIQDLFRAVIAEAESWVEAGFTTLALACPLWSQSLSSM